MKLKYAYILPSIYLFFFLLEAVLSKISNYPFRFSISLVDIPFAIITYIVTIMNLPFYL